MISGANDVRVTLGDKRDTSLPAKIVGKDDDKDVAVLKIEDTGGRILKPVKVCAVFKDNASYILILWGKFGSSTEWTLSCV